MTTSSPSALGGSRRGSGGGTVSVTVAPPFPSRRAASARRSAARSSSTGAVAVERAGGIVEQAPDEEDATDAHRLGPEQAVGDRVDLVAARAHRRPVERARACEVRRVGGALDAAQSGGEMLARGRRGQLARAPDEDRGERRRLPPEQELVDRRLQADERPVLLPGARDRGEREGDGGDRRCSRRNVGHEEQQQRQQRERRERRRCPAGAGELDRLSGPDQRCVVPCHARTVGPAVLRGVLKPAASGSG